MTKMFKSILTNGVLAWSAILLLTQCDTNSGAGDKSGYDRRPMLTRYADEFIAPAYQNLAINLDSLNKAFEVFATNKSVANLNAVRAAWLNTAKSFIKATPFDFGPADATGVLKTLSEEIGTFPVNALQIETFITQGQNGLTTFARDTRGIYAIEYFLYRKGISDDSVVATFGPARTQYIKDILADTKSKLSTVQQAWPNYRTNFVADNGTDAGSATTAFYNAFLKSYEGLKNFRVGLPLGERPGQTSNSPQSVEAYYSGQSAQLAQLHFNVLVDIWAGRLANGTTGPSLRDYTLNVEGGSVLVSNTDNAIAPLQQQLDAIAKGQPLSQQISDGKTEVKTLYNDLSAFTRFWKGDLSSLLGLMITYSSGDGD